MGIEELLIGKFEIKNRSLNDWCDSTSSTQILIIIFIKKNGVALVKILDSRRIRYVYEKLKFLY